MQSVDNNNNYWNRELIDRRMESSSSSSPSPENSLLMQPLSGVGGGGGGDGGLNGVGLGYIEHVVTKFDTLAGVAIKYGVEVADIKKMNGLTTDLQMFSRKTLHIPLPGRHPPSPIMNIELADIWRIKSVRTRTNCKVCWFVGMMIDDQSRIVS
nr:hypothetical protein [Tanacetum cinerariifolium]